MIEGLHSEVAFERERFEVMGFCLAWMHYKAFEA